MNSTHTFLVFFVQQKAGDLYWLDYLWLWWFYIACVKRQDGKTRQVRENVNNVMVQVIMAQLWRKLDQNKAYTYKKVQWFGNWRVGEFLLFISLKTMAGRYSSCVKCPGLTSSSHLKYLHQSALGASHV